MEISIFPWIFLVLFFEKFKKTYKNEESTTVPLKKLETFDHLQCITDGTPAAY